MELVTAKIMSELREAGSMTMARFVEMALYDAEGGYYEREWGRIGGRGDFITSVQVGPLFGRLLAVYLLERLEQLQLGSGELWLVEAGAHEGQLALDLLEAIRKEPEWKNRGVRYGIVEPSPRRREVQERKLASFSGQVHWWKEWAEVAPRSLRGVVFANELLDAMPFHRAVWDAGGKEWGEWWIRVGRGEGVEEGFRWERGEMSERLRQGNVSTLEVPDELAALLPDGFTVDVSPAASWWWAEAARRLEGGWLATFEYGLEKEGLLDPGRAEGTARAYWQHRMTKDLLARPGAQDLTYHVDFSELMAVGEGAGLRVDQFESQQRVLGKLLGRLLELGKLEMNREEKRQWSTLTHPAMMGEAFRVLSMSMGRREAGR